MLYGDEKFARIFASLQHDGRNIAWLFGYPKGWDEPGGLLPSIRAFVQDLQRANAITWNRQYENEKVPLSLGKLTGLPPYTEIEFYKSLRGLKYNLMDNEGAETNLAKSLERLDILIDTVGASIISKLPEWEAAKTW